MMRENAACDADYIASIAKKIAKKHPYSQMKSRLRLGDYKEWNNEGFALLNQAVNDQRFSPFGGGTLGLGGSSLAPDVERNSNYGDANYRLDLRIARDIRIGERAAIELIAESFNLFNRSNYNGFNGTLYDAVNPGLNATANTPIVLTRRANFGTPNNDGSPPDGTNARRFQLAVRFRF